MSKPDIAVLDLDAYKYSAAFVGEKRSVRVTHKTLGGTYEVNSRTEFYGDWRKKEGGILAQINKKRESPLLWDEFEYEDVQTLKDDIDNILITSHVMVSKDIKLSGAKSYIGFIGEGESFRVQRSTLMRYKDRGELLKPLLLDKVSDHLQEKFDAIIIDDGIEADDAILMECYNDPRKFSIGEDKDMWAQPMNVFDIRQTDRGIVNCNQFGRLFLDDKGKVRGEGRLFFYWQVAYGDDTDCYRSNCFAGKKFGEKGAYDRLVNCKNDKEALEALKQVYLMLYPEPKIVTGWRGDEIEIDAAYVFNEIWDMARMLRWKDDIVVGTDVMRRFGIEF